MHVATGAKMKQSISRRTFLAGTGVTLLAGCTDLVSSGDPNTPENLESIWPQPGYDYRMRNYALSATGPTEEVAELWSVTSESSFTQPVVDSNRLFVGSDGGTVRAFDARDGEDLWTVSVGETASRPQVGEDFLYVATQKGIVALTPDGDEEWQIDVVPGISHGLGRHGTVSGGGFLYTPHGLYAVRESDEACPDEEDDSCPSGEGQGPTTAALVSRHDPSDGTTVWEEPIFDPLSSHLFASDAALFVSSTGTGTNPWLLTPEDGRITDEVQGISHGPAEHCYSDGRVIGVDSWNGIYRTSELDGDSLDSANSESVSISAENLATDGERCYLSSSSGHGTLGIECISIDGENRWIHELDTVVGAPTVAEDVVVYRDEGTVYGVDPTDGTELWTHSAERFGSGVVIVDDILYTVDDRTIRAFRQSG